MFYLIISLTRFDIPFIIFWARRPAFWEEAKNMRSGFLCGLKTMPRAAPNRLPVITPLQNFIFFHPQFFNITRYCAGQRQPNYRLRPLQIYRRLLYSYEIPHSNPSSKTDQYLLCRWLFRHKPDNSQPVPPYFWDLTVPYYYPNARQKCVCFKTLPFLNFYKDLAILHRL